MSARFDWCVHGQHAACHREGTTTYGVIRCDCSCHNQEEAA